MRRSETLIWNTHFAGDWAAQARVMGSVMSIASVIGFVTTPWLASWADAKGRRPLMLLGAVASCVKFSLVTLRPTIGSIIFGNYIMVLNVYAWMMGTYAAAGDVHGDDPAALTLAQSRLQLMPQLGSVVMPLVGSQLAAINVRLPYAIASAAYFVQSLATWWLLPETLPRSARQPFKLRSASPLSVLKLFHSGPQVRLLALSMGLSEICGPAPRAMMMATNTQRDDLLGWSVLERGRHSSFTGIVALLGGFGAPRLIARLGESRAVLAGLCSYLLEMLFSATARQQRGVYAAKGAGIISFSAGVAMQARMTLAAAERGMLQGEIQGAVQNLRQLCSIVGPVLWGRAYAALSTRGLGPRLYWGPLAVTALQLALVPFVGYSGSAETGKKSGNDA